MVPPEDVATGLDEDVGCRVLDKEVAIPGTEEGVPGTEDGVPGMEEGVSGMEDWFPVMAGILVEVGRSCEVINDLSVVAVLGCEGVKV